MADQPSINCSIIKLKLSIGANSWRVNPNRVLFAGIGRELKSDEQIVETKQNESGNVSTITII
jgi:hypothetical protein